MNTLDIERLASAARLPILQRRIAELKSEAEIFKRDCRAPFDHSDKKFLPLDAKVIERARAKGHRVDWQPLPPFTADEVRATYDCMLREIEAAEQEAVALEDDAR